MSVNGGGQAQLLGRERILAMRRPSIGADDFTHLDIAEIQFSQRQLLVCDEVLVIGG